MFPKIMLPPIHPFVHRVWNHYFHHPFWAGILEVSSEAQAHAARNLPSYKPSTEKTVPTIPWVVPPSQDAIVANEGLGTGIPEPKNVMSSGW